MKLCRAIVVFVVALFLVGCSLTSPVKMPRMSSYTISSPFISIPKNSKTRLAILVSMPVASSGYQSSNMVYVDRPYKLKSFANNRWVSAPTEILLPLLAQRLRSYGYFKAVVTPPFAGVTNYRLDTQLLILQQEFLQPTSLVRLVMQVTLVNNTINRVVASRHFQVMVRAPGNNPYSGVLATNKASNVMSKRISTFVIQSIR